MGLSKIQLRLLELTRLAKEKKREKEEGASTLSCITTPPVTKASTTLASALARIKDRLEADKKVVPSVAPSIATKEEAPTHIGIDGSVITYNKEQVAFSDLLASGKSCVLIGSAGSGKTTCTQGGLAELIQTGLVPTLNTDGHKHLANGSPGIVIISATRRAVNNIRKVLPADLKGNCITGHKLLEFAPEFYEVWDEEAGEYRKTMQFIPARNATNPLPSSIYTIIVEEASMLDVPFYKLILASLSHGIQWVFIGDINQLPPVFGSAILGYKMLELPVVELTHIYRQALESPIIRLAHRILSGKPIPVEEFPEWKVKGELTLHAWKKKLDADNALNTLAEFFKAAITAGSYNPEHDMILIPYNKACGTLELNKKIANFLARKRGANTFEIVAGFNKIYLSEGDKILYDKEDATVLTIAANPAYTGARFQPDSKTLDYWGYNPNIAEDSYSGFDIDDVDLLLAQVETGEDRVTQSSHKIEIELADSREVITLTKAGDINNLLHGYALTVHKAQGSEWRKVFLCLHQSHATMLQRELLYTAVTRAREELYVICEPESFVKGIKSQKIKGNTLAEKAEWFKGKKESNSGAY